MPYYTRARGYRFNWNSYITPGIKWLVIACAAIFLLQELSLMLFGAAGWNFWMVWFGLVPAEVTHGYFIWQPFTYLFLHGGLLHILINMFFLWMFGVDIERAWGTRRFLTYYTICGVGAGVINVIVKTIMDPHPVAFPLPSAALIPTIGASGAIFGVLLAAAILFPDRQVWLIPFPISMPMRIYVLVMGAIEFFATLGAGGDNVSHICHLGGILVGYIYLRRSSFLYGYRNRVTEWKHRRMLRKFEVYQKRHRDDPPSRPDNWVN
jgi:membrane associated rhomboid family serine protease